MAVRISGVLLDGAGLPVAGCRIELRARKTSSTVVVHVASSTLTAENGQYLKNESPAASTVGLLAFEYSKF